MAVKASVDTSNQTTVRVGQQNATKVTTTQTGIASAVYADFAYTVRGGVADVTKLNVSGISTLSGIVTTGTDLYVGGDLYVSDDITVDELNARNLNVTGISTFTGAIGANNLSVSGISTFNDDVVFKGNTSNAKWDSSTNDLILFNDTRLEFGSNKDFEIWHGGSHTFLKNSGGDLRIRGDKILLKREDGSETYLEANANNEVKLFFNGNEKFATTLQGVEIGTVAISTVGFITATDVWVSGAVTATSYYGDGTNLTNTGAVLSAASGSQRIILSSLDSGIMTTAATDGDLTWDSTTNTLSATNVSIAGTLTYEDVTNVDSVGIVTAGKGLRVTTGGLVVTAGVSTLGVSTFTGAVSIGDSISVADNKRIYFGDDQDLSIRHNEPGHSYIQQGSGKDLVIQTGVLRIVNSADNKDLANFTEGSYSRLYYDGTERISTSGLGITVTGVTSTTDLYVTGITTVGFATATDVLVSGAVTATSFYGDGSNLTGVSTANVITDSLVVSGISTFHKDVEFIGGGAGITSAYWDQSDTSLKFLDEVKVKFGDHNDLSIYHTTASGGYSVISEDGTGQLVIGGNIIEFKNEALNQSYATIDSTGIDVTGHTETDTLNVSGISTFAGDVNLGSSGTNTITITGVVDSDIVPTGTTRDLGSSTSEWRNLFIDGIAYIDDLRADTAKIGDLTDNRVVLAGSEGELEDDANLTFNGSTLSVGVGLNISGIATLAGITTVTGETLFTKQLSVSGLSTFSSAVNITADSTVAATLNTRTLSVAANHDIQFASGTWSGNIPAKMQHHNNIFYSQGGSDGWAFLASGGAGRLTIDGDGHMYPGSDSTYDLGTTDKKWRNFNVNNVNITGVSTFAGITTVTGETLFTKQLSVSGLSTYIGVATYKSDVFVDGTLTAGAIDGGTY